MVTILYGILKPFLMTLPAETAHGLSISFFKAFAKKLKSQDPILKTKVAGLSFPSPIGIAAGYDKNAEVVPGLFGLGFGFVEVGTLTPKPQTGNPKPRIFRLKEDGAIINRLGFNNKGFEAGLKNLESIPKGARRGILGINVGANKDSKDQIPDYTAGIKRFSHLADYFTINVSSPNTPGLRDLQAPENLSRLIRAVKAELGKSDIPVFVKIAPDLTGDQLKVIVKTALDEKATGLIISNTTIERPKGLKSQNKREAGGLSGAPLFDPSTKMLNAAYKLSKGKLVLIGVGGVSSPEQAFEKIISGASLVQLYTGLVYEGPGLVKKLNVGVAERLKAHGFSSVSDAVGSAVK